MRAGIKMLALDLDGTLLDANRALSVRNIEAVQRAVDAGIVVVLASGRALCTMTPFADRLELTSPMVSCNGAYAVDALGQEIFHHSLGALAVKAIVDHAKSGDTYVNLYARSQVFASHGGQWLDLYRKRTGALPAVCGHDELGVMEATKILFVDEPAHIPGHQRKMELLADNLDFEITLSERDYIEFLPKGITKAVGVERTASHLGFEASEVAAIGDWYNDLDLIKWAGLGAAVGNAAEPVRQAADVVVASNEQHGVAEFIDQYLLK